MGLYKNEVYVGMKVCYGNGWWLSMYRKSQPFDTLIWTPDGSLSALASFIAVNLMGRIGSISPLDHT